MLNPCQSWHPFAHVLVGVTIGAFMGCTRAADRQSMDAAALPITPVLAEIGVGEEQRFVGSAFESRPSQANVRVVPSGGTIDKNGLYTAPVKPGLYRLAAVSGDEGPARATALVKVVAYPSDPVYSLPADRVTTWKPGVTLNGGIPLREKICASFSASDFENGKKNASSAIQSAIHACPEGQVVKFGAGTFLVNDLLLVDKGITLRGEGADRTTLLKSNGARPLSYSPVDAQPIIVVGPNRWPKVDEASAQDLLEDGVKGAMSVRVARGSAFQRGELVLLDELSGAAWQPDPLGRGKIWASPDWHVVWQLHEPHQPIDDPLVAETPTGGDAASWFCRRDRPVSEMKEIRTVDGNVVTFTTPLHTSYRKGLKAQLTPGSGPGSEPVRSAGIERLRVVGGSDGAIRFVLTAYSWARNVEVTEWLGEGFAVNSSFRVEIRDSYIHDGVWPQPGGGGYAVSLAAGTSELLFENNISRMANKVMVARSAGAGSVFGYNYVDDGFILSSERWIEIGLNASHMVGPHHVLFEGNLAFNFDSDKTHGSATYHTVFRNWLRGVRSPFVNPSTGDAVNDESGADGPKRCAGAAAYSYYMSYVGNVLGEKDRMNGFVYDSVGSRSMVQPAIWLLGWDEVAPYGYDPAVEATAIRDGNFDWLQQKQSWHNAQPRPLPDSLYLSKKPSFFGDNPWPWVDPSTGRTYVLPAKARFDAGTPNLVP